MGMQKIRRRKIGEMMVAEGLITPDQLAEALEHQKQSGESIGEVLLNDRLVTENDIVRTICTQYQVPYLSPLAYERNSELASQFDKEFLYRNRLLPIDKIGDSYIVVVGDLPSEAVEEKLTECFGEEVYYYFSTSSEIKQIIVEQFSISQDDALLYDDARGAQKLSDRQRQAAPPDQSQLLDTLDSSWESIFDEAEKNIT